MESKFARIGRTYPRPVPTHVAPATRRRIRRRYRITGVIAILSALGLIGWFLR